MTSLLALPPVFGVAFDVEAVIPDISSNENGNFKPQGTLISHNREGCLTGQPDQICALLDVGCSLRWKERLAF